MAWNRNSAKAQAWREQRDARIKELTEEFERRVDMLHDTAEWRNLLNYFATFHQYSFKNVMLIRQQRPNATWVAGYRAWVARGRQVRKGEKGLLIVQPSGKREVRDKKGNTVLDKNGNPVERQGFKMGTVFDISQTDPVPGADTLEQAMSHVAKPLQGDAGKEIVRRTSNWLTGYAGWTVTQSDAMPDGMHGDIDFEGRVITLNPDDSWDMRATTLLTNAAHVVMTVTGDPHHMDGGAKSIASTESASVAFVLAGMMGLDTSGFTIGYAAGWSLLDRSSLKGIGQHVQKTVRLMADAILAANMPDEPVNELEGARMQIAA